MDTETTGNGRRDGSPDLTRESPDPSEAGSRQAGGSPPPIAIVGMACRFPGAPDIPAFWRLLEAGWERRQRGRSGFRGRALGPALCGGGGAERRLPFRRLHRRHRPLRRRVLPHIARRGAAAGSAAAADARDELAGPRGRGDRSGRSQGKPHRRLHRDQQRRVPNAGPRVEQARRGRRVPLRPQRHQPQRRRRTGLLRDGSHGTGQGGGRRVRLLPGLGPRRRGRPAAGQGGPGHRRRRAGPPERPHLRAARRCDDALSRRAVQDLRCFRKRLRAGRGLRGRRPEAAERGRGGRRPHLGGDPGRRGEQRRRQRRTDGPEHTRPRAGDGRGPVGGGHPSVGGRLPGGPRDRYDRGRSDRDQRGDGRLRPGTQGGSPAARRLGEDQHRPPGVGCRRGRTDQGGAGPEAGRDPEAPPFPGPRAECRLGPASGTDHVGDDGLAAPRMAAGGRGELLRHIRDQRPPRGGGVRRPGCRTLGRPGSGPAAGGGGPGAGGPGGSAVGGAGGRAPPDPSPAAVGQVRRRPPGSRGTVPVVARRARRRRWFRIRGHPCGHGLDGGCRAQSLRTPGRGRVRRSRLAARGPRPAGGVRPRSRGQNAVQNRLRLYRTGKPVGRHGPGPLR